MTGSKSVAHLPSFRRDELRQVAENGERALLHRVGDQDQQAEDLREVPEVAPKGRDGGGGGGDDSTGTCREARRGRGAVLGVQTDVQGRALPRLHADHDLRGRRVGRFHIHIKDVGDGNTDVVFTFVGLRQLGLPSSASRAAKVIAGVSRGEADETAVPLVDGFQEEREGAEEKQLRVSAPKRTESPLLELSQLLQRVYENLSSTYKRLIWPS